MGLTIPVHLSRTSRPVTKCLNRSRKRSEARQPAVRCDAKGDGDVFLPGAVVSRMSTAQLGIFAMGTPSHLYLEFDRRPGRDGRALATGVADLREPRTTIGGVNLGAGFRPELWRELQPGGGPPN